MEQIGWPVVLMQVTGADSERYLHNRLTNNIKSLTVGSAVWAAALTPQGKTQALFLVKRAGKDSFLLLAEGGDFFAIKEALLKFKVADRIVVEQVENVSAFWQPGAPLTATPAHCQAFQTSFGQEVGTLVVGSQECLLSAHTNSSVITFAQYGFLSAAQLFPRFPTELNEKFLFSEAGLELAVSYNKGCFVGQEVVHKISAFATLPYELAVAAFSGDLPAEPGKPVSADNGESIGSIVSMYKAKGQTLCFVRIKSECTQGLTTINFCPPGSHSVVGRFLGVCEHGAKQVNS